MSPKEIFSQLSHWILKKFLQSYTFCLYFILFLHVWIRIRILDTDPDQQSSWIRIQYGSGSGSTKLLDLIYSTPRITKHNMKNITLPVLLTTVWLWLWLIDVWMHAACPIHCTCTIYCTCSLALLWPPPSHTGPWRASGSSRGCCTSCGRAPGRPATGPPTGGWPPDPYNTAPINIRINHKIGDLMYSYFISTDRLSSINWHN